jgi:S1-C subfamily serine protease
MRCRLVVVAALWSALFLPAAGQEQEALLIKMLVLDDERKATPVARHALLISENPAGGEPRRITTGLDGAVEVRLRPGSYIVESDRPFALGGRTYQWTQVVEIVAGRDAVLELTADNAEIETAGAAAAAEAPGKAGPSALWAQWQGSVVAVWTPTAHATGFVIDAKGLIATNQRVVSKAAAVEVQITPSIKVAGNVLVADAARDVAILWIDPSEIASVRPIPLRCERQPQPPARGDEIVTIEAPLYRPKDMTSGTVNRVLARAIGSDLNVAAGATGGPVFTVDGSVVGITSVVDENDIHRSGDVRVVRVGDVCEVVAAAEPKMNGASPPGAARLPVEPVATFPRAALDAMARRRAGNLSSYQTSTADFDIALLTPVLTYGARGQREPLIGPLMDFANWREYVAEIPPVLLVRVTPKLVEGFWTKVARGAAQVQGLALPPIKRFRSGFLQLRARCGDAEVPPVHPFKIERRVTESDAIYEGLYVFDPDAFGPACGSVTLTLYSEKDPVKGETRIVDASIIKQIWQDFEPYRAAK